MTLALIAVAGFVGINLLGLAWSLWRDRHPVADAVSVQTQARKPGALRRRLPLILLNLALMAAATGIGLTVASPWISASGATLGRLAGDFALVLLVDDLVFYVVHRAIHEHRGLYRALHALHHEAYAPLPIEYLYVHPGELAAGALGPALGGLAVIAVHGELTFAALLAYGLFRAGHELDLHSGVRGALSPWLPLLAPPAHHDLHHHRPRVGNYGSMLTLWDRVLGTYTPADVGGRQAAVSAPVALRHAA